MKLTFLLAVLVFVSVPFEARSSDSELPSKPQPPAASEDSPTVKSLPLELERRLRDLALSFERSRSEAYRSYVEVLMSEPGRKWIEVERKAKSSSAELQTLESSLKSWCLQFSGMALNIETYRCEKVPEGTVLKSLSGKGEQQK